MIVIQTVAVTFGGFDKYDYSGQEQKMFDKLICPDCKQRLTNGKDEIFCNHCKRTFRVTNGIPVIFPKSLSDFKKVEINYFEKEFKNKENLFGLAESDWKKNTFGLLDFMDMIEKYSKDSQILELGAGNGDYSVILRKRGFKNTTISDIVVEALIPTQKYLKDSPSSLFVFDAENIPFESNSFDIIFSVAAFHHFPNPDKVLAEMKRCVKPKGLIIVAVEPNTWYYYTIRPIASLLRIRKIDNSKDLFSIGDEVTRGFYLSRLKKYFKKYGIDIMATYRIWYVTGFIFYLPDFIKRIFKITISINPKVRIVTLKIDKFIEKIPLINKFSFHNTIVGKKESK